MPLFRSLTLVVEQARDAFVSIGEAVEDMTGRIEQVLASTEGTSATTEQVAASAHELASNAASLEHLVTRFKVNP